jgi:hypothetical protein
MNRIALVFGIAASALAVGTAWAGVKYTDPLTISTTGMYAAGSFADVRSESDAKALLTCSISATATGLGMGCSGSTSTASFYCSSTAPSLVSAAQNLSSDSYIFIEWNSSGACTYLSVTDGSTEAPKQP